MRQRLLILTLIIAATCSWRSTTYALSNGCINGFRDIARMRRSPDFKNNPGIKLWVYEEAGLWRAADRLREKIENTLRDATPTIRRMEMDSGQEMEILDFGGGVRGIFKDWTPETARELTAYRFDRKIKLRMIPISVERTINGRRGVVQLYIPDRDGVAMTYNPAHLQLVDFLMRHTDRHDENYLTYEGRTILIDNEKTFYADDGKKYVSEIDFPAFVARTLAEKDSAAAANIIATSLVSPDVIERLRTITDQEWRDTLNDLKPGEIASFLKRKDDALAAIKLAESRLGPSIFPAGPFSALARNRWAVQLERIADARKDPRVPAAVKQRLFNVITLIEKESVFHEELTTSQRKTVEDAMIELDTYR